MSFEAYDVFAGYEVSEMLRVARIEERQAVAKLFEGVVNAARADERAKWPQGAAVGVDVGCVTHYANRIMQAWSLAEAEGDLAKFEAAARADERAKVLAEVALLGDRCFEGCKTESDHWACCESFWLELEELVAGTAAKAKGAK